MKILSQNITGNLTESRVKLKLESLGLVVRKPIPDIGVDFEVFSSLNPTRIAKIQVKGRNPKLIKSYRWFQLRVQKRELEVARNKDIPASETWQRKIRMVDFFILDAVYFDEMWILSQKQTFELISLNEYQYGTRPDNIFVYEVPLRMKQKEMNLESHVPGIPIIDRFGLCKNNFNPLLDFLGISL
jgi:hypothetical protein